MLAFCSIKATKALLANLLASSGGTAAAEAEAEAEAGAGAEAAWRAVGGTERERPSMGAGILPPPWLWGDPVRL